MDSPRTPVLSVYDHWTKKVFQIKLGLIKQFFKTLNKNGKLFFIIFNLWHHKQTKTIADFEVSVWCSFVSDVRNLLDNHTIKRCFSVSYLFYSEYFEYITIFAPNKMSSYIPEETLELIVASNLSKQQYLNLPQAANFKNSYILNTKSVVKFKSMCRQSRMSVRDVHARFCRACKANMNVGGKS